MAGYCLEGRDSITGFLYSPVSGPVLGPPGILSNRYEGFSLRGQSSMGMNLISYCLLVRLEYVEFFVKSFIRLHFLELI